MSKPAVVKRPPSPAEKILGRLSSKAMHFELSYRDDGLWHASYEKRSVIFEYPCRFVADDLLTAAEQLYVRLLDACPYHGVGLVQNDYRVADCPRKDCDFRTVISDA